MVSFGVLFVPGAGVKTNIEHITNKKGATDVGPFCFYLNKAILEDCIILFSDVSTIV